MAQETARFRDVFAVSEFRVLWIAQTQSRIGDQLARVALALLVFDRSSSPALTALVYALTYLPPLVTAPLLAGIADRYSRRAVLVWIDVLRAVVIAAMAVPGLPLPVVCGLVLLATCPQPLFSAARTAVLPNVLPGERYPVGMSIMASTDGAAQIIGFAAGGLMVAFFGGPHVTLAVNAGTFLLSAVLLRWGIRPHLPDRSDGSRGGGFALAGIRLVVRDRRLLGLASLIWLFGLFLAPEALAAPYAAQINVGDAAVGTLMAADVVGMVIGAVLVARLGAKLRRRVTVPLAVATGVPLLVTAFGFGVPVTFALWAVSGLLGSYMTLAQIEFTQRVPDGLRARAIGFASAGLQTAQGLGVLIAGLLAEFMPPSMAIAACAAVGLIGAVAINLACRLHADPSKDLSAGTDGAEPPVTESHQYMERKE